MEIKEILSALTIEEKIRLLSGDGSWHTYDCNGKIPKIMMTDGPHGLRKQEAEALYRGFGAAYRVSENWQLYLLSSHTEFERSFGAQADKKRKLYNGMIKCDLFMYLKPGKK